MGNKSSSSGKGKGYTSVDIHEVQNHHQYDFDDSTHGDEVKESTTDIPAIEWIHDAKTAFNEGNRLFRESRFDLAKTEYHKA